MKTYYYIFLLTALCPLFSYTQAENELDPVPPVEVKRSDELGPPIDAEALRAQWEDNFTYPSLWDVSLRPSFSGQIRLSGIITTSEGPKAAFTDGQSQQVSRWLKEGSSFMGLTIIEIFPEEERVLVKNKDGELLHIYPDEDPYMAEQRRLQAQQQSETTRKLSESESASKEPEGYLNLGLEETGQENPNQPAEVYLDEDILPSERERGINPNDPSTWPSDYPGPTIERMMQQP